MPEDVFTQAKREEALLVPWAVRRWTRLVRKELRETLRDQRTLFTLIAMPLIVYPLLGGVFKKFLLANLRGDKPAEVHVAVQNEQEASYFEGLLKEGNAWISMTRGQGIPGGEEIWSNAGKSQIAFMADLEHENISPGEQVQRGFADIALVRQRADVTRGILRDQILIFFNPASAASVQARAMLEPRLMAASIPKTAQRVLTNPRLIELLPTELVGVVVQGGDGVQSSVVQTLLPLVLILTTVTGAVYPAIDLTAGERERGTLETLLAAPVPRIQVLTAKYAAVTTVAVITAAVNLAAMAITIWALDLGGLLFGGVSPSPWLAPSAFAILCVFAAFFSAMLLSVTSMARSFKEAQAYVIPLFLIALSPAVFALAPNITLTPAIALAPVMNLVLVARGLLSGELQSREAAIALVSTALYGYAALTLAAKTFGADSATNLHDIHLGVKRSHWNERPAFSVAWLVFFAVLPLFVLTNTLPGKLPGASFTEIMLASAVLQVTLFGGAILTGLIWSKARPFPSLALYPGRLAVYPIAAVLACCLWPLAYELTLLAGDDLVKNLGEKFAAYVEKLKSTPASIRLLSMAIIPAAMEECFFRGFLFSAFRSRWTPRATILATSLLFGVMHVVTQDSLFLLRLAPSTALGLVLGYVRARGGSLLPCIVLHAGHNGLLLSKDQFPGLLKFLGLDVEGTSHLPSHVIAASALIFAASLVLLTWLTRNAASEPATNIE